jgi:uncharacterized membrane protein
MKPNFLKRFRNFLRTTLFGGLAAILPLALVIVFFRWIIQIIHRYLEPLVSLIRTDSQIQVIALYVLAVLAILFSFFFIGLVIRTRLGRFFNEVLEEKYLMKIPGYKIARDTVMQFFGKNRSFFSEVVLVDIFKTGTLMTGFITDESGDFLTVFVPTGPNPTSGNIYHVNKNQVIHTDIGVDTGMKSIISCGAGSSELFENRAGE